LVAIPQINGIAGVVFAVARGGADLRPGFGILVTFRLKAKENRLLLVIGSVAGEGD
jgi:hypothetical protein